MAPPNASNSSPSTTKQATARNYDCLSGSDVNGVAAQKRPELEAELQATLNVIPAYTWYALPSGALVFVNEPTADYLGLPKDHALRFGIDTGAAWDSHIPLLHPDGQRLADMGSCWAFNPSGFFEYWSQELFKIYGLDPQKGAPTLEQYLATVHPLDRDFMAENMKRMHAERSGCDVKKTNCSPRRRATLHSLRWNSRC